MKLTYVTYAAHSFELQHILYLYLYLYPTQVCSYSPANQYTRPMPGSSGRNSPVSAIPSVFPPASLASPPREGYASVQTCAISLCPRCARSPVPVDHDAIPSPPTDCIVCFPALYFSLLLCRVTQTACPGLGPLDVV